MAKSLHDLASEASKKAKRTGTPEAHRDAAAAQQRAAVFAKNEGDRECAASHAEAAAKHRRKAKKADENSDSSSVQAEDNPMFTWATAKQQ
jgi:hypothetical protein